jgi:hypothetical protein
MNKFIYECRLIHAKFLGADPRIMKSIRASANQAEWAARLVFESKQFLPPNETEWLPCGDLDDPESIVLEVTVGGVGTEVTINAFNRELHTYTPLLIGGAAPKPLLTLTRDYSYWACTDIQTQNRRKPPYDVRRVFLDPNEEGERPSRMLWYLLDGEPVDNPIGRPIGVAPSVLSPLAAAQ